MTFVFRNNTIEPFFSGNEFVFSGYEDIAFVPQDADRYIWFYQSPFCINSKKTAETINSYSERLGFIVSQIQNHKTVILFTMFDIYSVDSVDNDFAYKEAIYSYNQKLFNLEREFKNIKVFDSSDFFSRYGKNELVDWKYYFISQMALNPRLAPAFKKWFAKKERGLLLNRKKCLVLDLDNTLWGGILGEDGVEGIKIGGDYPGKAYSFFQKQISHLAEEGVILAVCSKNNEEDVLNAWKENKNIIVNSGNVSVYQINWDDKATNIARIAETLNIGLDSMVFIDDNPTERELVKTRLPMVEVPEFPDAPYKLPDFFKSVVEDYFSIYELSDEDRSKTQSYKANAERKNARNSFSNLDDFIKSLEIELDIEEATDLSIQRIAQMTQKTNQFNLTTRRYSEQDIHSFLSAGWKIYTVSVKDKFGDEGITGAIFITLENEIDTFLMSCRVLGRGIEKEFLKTVLGSMPKDSVARASFIPTQKNSQVREFYETNGFALLEQKDSGEKTYELDLQDYESVHSENYKIILGGE